MKIPQQIGILFLAIYLILVGLISLTSFSAMSSNILAILGIVVGVLLIIGK